MTGLDLTSLVIGSEGTLGVIVGATLKLRRLVPGEVCTIAATFPDVRTAAEASAAVTASGVQPAIMELMDAASLAAVHALLSLDPPTPGAAQLTIQTDGPAADVEADAIAAVLRPRGGTVAVSHDRAEGERLLAIRRSMHPAMETLGTTLIEDVSVPRSALPAMFDEIARVEREHGVVIPTVAHAGDGNLHPNFIFERRAGRRRDVEVPERIWDAADDLFRAALRLGGTLTGEHGVGVLKRRVARRRARRRPVGAAAADHAGLRPAGHPEPRQGVRRAERPTARHRQSPARPACCRRCSGSSPHGRAARRAASSTTTVACGCSWIADPGSDAVSGPSTAPGDRLGLALAEGEQHEVAGAQDRAEALGDAVPRHVVDRVEEPRVVFARLLGERLHPGQRGEGRARLVEADVAVRADPEELQVDAAGFGDRALVVVAGVLDARRATRPARGSGAGRGPSGSTTSRAITER